jgi:hypothetical protein
VSRPAKALLHSSLLLLVLLVVGFLYLDRIVGRAIEIGGSRALGVRTDVGGVEIAVLRGRVGLDDLEIANPEGFPGEHFLKLGSVRVEVQPRALLADTVVVPRIALDDLELALVGSPQGTNYGRILKNVEALQSGQVPPQPDASTGKGFVVQDLVVRNVKATLALEGLGQRVGTSIDVPEIHLRDVGAGDPVQLAELIAQVTDAVVRSVIAKEPALAGQLASELRGGIETGTRRARDELERLGEGLGGILRRPQ